jgi:hypothetical protein
MYKFNFNSRAISILLLSASVWFDGDALIRLAVLGLTFFILSVKVE